MKWSLVGLAVTAISISASAQTPTITRLDGTPISASEIDATMTRLLGEMPSEQLARRQSYPKR